MISVVCGAAHIEFSLSDVSGVGWGVGGGLVGLEGGTGGRETRASK